jgi:hypothetical protein
MTGKTKRLVRGVGINDADYVQQVKRTVGYKNGRQVQRSVWTCPFYTTWSNMLDRCYDAKTQEKFPTYKGCFVCDEWILFSNFKAWMETQDWEDNFLDKDILVFGNKIYSPENCVFVSRAVNNFVIEHSAARGEWPLGVNVCTKSNQFVARCSNPITGKREFLGRFICPQEAHQVWLKRKLELAKLLAEEQDDSRVAKALVERYENYGK